MVLNNLQYNIYKIKKIFQKTIDMRISAHYNIGVIGKISIVRKKHTLFSAS